MRAPRYFSGEDGSLSIALAAVEAVETRQEMAARGVTSVPLDGEWRLADSTRDKGGAVRVSPPESPAPRRLG